MAMNSNAPAGDVISDLNTTPLIDVLLVLLVLLLITLPIQTHAVKLAMGGHSPPVLPAPPIVDLGIDFDGTISWNGHKMDRAALDRQLAGAARQNPQPEIHVTADRLARYDTVAKVLSDAQRLGVRSMGIVNTNRFVE